MRRFTQIIQPLVLLTALFANSSVQARPLMDVYLELIDEITRRFPSDSHIYVPMGSSPTMISAILEHQQHDVVAMPLSSVGKEWHPWLPKVEGLKEYLHEHFRAFLPEKTEKTLVIIDYANTGDTIKQTVELIEDYYKGRVKIEPLVFTSPSKKRLFSDWPEKNWIGAYDDYDDIYLAMKNSDYETLAKWGKFEPPKSMDELEAGYVKPTPNEHYQEIVDEVSDYFEGLRKKSGCAKGLSSLAVAEQP